MFHDIQLDPVTDQVIHVDCLAVNKDEKVHAEVPVILIGESPFEKDGLGRVQLLRDTLEVEALPMDLPQDIQIDVSHLTEGGMAMHINDIIVGEKVTLLGDEEITVLSTVAFREEVKEEEEGEGEEGEGEEGEEGDKEGTEEESEKKNDAQ